MSNVKISYQVNGLEVEATNENLNLEFKEELIQEITEQAKELNASATIIFTEKKPIINIK